MSYKSFCSEDDSVHVKSRKSTDLPPSKKILSKTEGKNNGEGEHKIEEG